MALLIGSARRDECPLSWKDHITAVDLTGKEMPFADIALAAKINSDLRPMT